MIKKVIIFFLFVICGLPIFSQPPTHFLKKGEGAWKVATGYDYFEKYGKPNDIELINYDDSIEKWNKGIPCQPGNEWWLVNPKTFQAGSNDPVNQDLGVENNNQITKPDEEQSKTPSIEGAKIPNQGHSIIDSQTDTKTGSKSASKEVQKKGNYSVHWLWLPVFLLFGAVLGVLFFYFLFVKKKKTDFEWRERELSKKNTSLLDEKAEQGREISRLKTKIQSIDRERQKYFDENIALGEQIDRLKASQIQESKDVAGCSDPVVVNPASESTSSPSVLYADAIIDDYFVKTKETPDDDVIFILNLNGEDTASFSIYKPAYPKVLANPSFLEGCERQILDDAMRLEVVSEGKAQKEFLTGKWKVVNKLNVTIK